MEQTVRNKLRNVVTQCRRLLEEAVAQELEGKLGVRAGKKGAVQIEEEAKLTNLGEEEVAYRRDLLDHLRHIESRGLTAGAALEQLIREIAFTHVNRLCAYKMMEARQVYVGGQRFREAVSRGYESNGVKFYLADHPEDEKLYNTGHQDEAYRRFLDWLGGLLSQEIGVLFDPDDPANRLYPPHRVIGDVLDLINDEELAGIWSQDETIGWVYQYFTPKELREKARKESSAPRNSYELAFRNQFYTPRYVVQFLTDNTLGRIWYEMRQGDTRLADQCEYMVRRPDEVFLAVSAERQGEGEDDPDLAFVLGRTDETAEFTVPEHTWHTAPGTLPVCTGDDAAGRLARLAHLVRPFEWTGDPRTDGWKALLAGLAEGQPEQAIEGKTQDLWDCLFAVHRADRFNEGLAAGHAVALTRIADEIRRRVLVARKEDASSEELLRAPYLVPFRERKDPREIKVLDPACGSGHFLLYCFDLLLTVYEEAWEDEEAGRRPRTERVSLRDQYGSKEEMLRDVPALILEHNLHGIDIDLRATQIAALALWLRAQRAYQDLGLAGDRPPITRVNVVCAEPMPGEDDMLEEFCGRLSSEPVAELTRAVFERMKLAGEAGSLLRIEVEIAQEIRRVVPGHGGLWAADDEKQWQKTETELLHALRAYAEEAQNGRTHQRRLFARDALQGFGLIDLCRQWYDAVLMNPPFGEPVPRVRPYLAENFPVSRADIGMVFVDRWADRLAQSGQIGAITNRVFIANDSLETWRRERLLGGSCALQGLLDLGYGVLEGALVEAAAYVVRAGPYASSGVVFDRVLDELRKDLAAHDLVCSGRPRTRSFRFVRQLAAFARLPGAVIAYQVPEDVLRRVLVGAVLGRMGGRAAQGLITGDDFRFVRLAWEVPPARIGVGNDWVYFAKGGEYSPYWDDIHLVVDWRDDGAAIRSLTDESGRLRSRPQNTALYGRPGVTYPERTTSDFSPRVLPAACIFSAKGQAVFCEVRDLDLAYIGGSYSRHFKLLIDAFTGSGDSSVPGAAATDYRCGLLQELPPPIHSSFRTVQQPIRDAISRVRARLARDETTRFFVAMPGMGPWTPSLLELARELHAADLEGAVDLLRASRELERAVEEDLGLSAADRPIVDGLVGPHPLDYPAQSDEGGHQVCRLWGLSESALIREATAKHGARRQLTKRAYIADRRLELVAHCLCLHAETLATRVKVARLLAPGTEAFVASSVVQLALGASLGRWDVRYVTGERRVPELPDPFDPMPACPPGMLQTEEGAPATETPGGYPIVIDWDGILVDDLTHPDDVTAKVREVLAVIWGERAEAIEQEACHILGVEALRDYFRKTRAGGFWDDHVKRYSKSRRKAPIYWYLRSAQGNYGLWLYYHRLDKDILHKALVNYVEPKLRLEHGTLDRLRKQREAAGTAGGEAKGLERDLDTQEGFVSELEDFGSKLRRVAELRLEPDLNDGVVLNIAPLRELVPWSEAQEYWDELLEGKCEWSTIGKQLRERGLVAQEGAS